MLVKWQPWNACIYWLWGLGDINDENCHDMVGDDDYDDVNNANEDGDDQCIISVPLIDLTRADLISWSFVIVAGIS